MVARRLALAPDKRRYQFNVSRLRHRAQCAIRVCAHASCAWQQCVILVTARSCSSMHAASVNCWQRSHAQLLAALLRYAPRPCECGQSCSSNGYLSGCTSCSSRSENSYSCAPHSMSLTISHFTDRLTRASAPSITPATKLQYFRP